MRLYKGIYVTETYKQVLKDLKNNPNFIIKPRGIEVKEIRDCAIEVLNPMVNIYENKYRSSPLKYIAAELLWYFSGTNNPTYIEKYASLWKNIHNEDGTVNSAYGNLIFNQKNQHGLTQYEWVIESLKADKDSRQAFMHFNKPTHQYFSNKDQVCTLQSMFHIRQDRLYMTIDMRSNDVIYGFMTDWAFFSVLFYHVYLDLKKYYKGLRLGSYTHISHSMHVYERHYDLLNKMNEDYPFKENSLPFLSETVVDEKGNIKDKYKSILEPIIEGKEPDYSQKTGNDLIDWCLEKLK